jgi:hypothetical protein
METQETVAPTTEAVIEESASSTNELPEGQEVAPATERTTEVEGTEPSKAVKELIAQRKKRQEAERELAYYKGLAEGRGASPVKPEPVIQQASPQLPVPPKQDDFETWEAYETAKDDYLIAKAEHNMALRFLEGQQQVKKQEVEKTYQQRMAEAALVDPDIMLLQNDRTLPVSGPMAELIQYSEKGPELLRWLDNNRQEALRIYNLPPILAAKEMGAVEEKLRNQPVVKPKLVSAAPDPIKTVTPSGTTTIDEDKLPTEEWIARRNEAQFKRR